MATIQQVARRINKLGREGDRAAGLGLRVVGEAIATDVKASRPGKGVPVDTGALRASIRVTGPQAVDGVPTVTLSAGGASAPYALRQHEDLSYHHTVGEARYLVRGIERFQAEGFRASAQALEEQMKFAIARASGSG